MAPAVTADVPYWNVQPPDYFMCRSTLRFKDKALNQAFLRQWITINLARLDRIFIVFCLLVIFAVIATVHDHDLPTRIRLHSWFLTFSIWGWFSLMRSPFTQRLYVQYRSYWLILLRLILFSPGDCVIERIHASDHTRPAAEFLRLLLFKTQAVSVVLLALGSALPFNVLLAMQPYHLQYLWFNSRGVSEQLCGMQPGWLRAAQWGLSWYSTLLQPLTQGVAMELQKELAVLRPASGQQNDTGAQLGGLSNTTVNSSLSDTMQCENASQIDVMACCHAGWNGTMQSCHNTSWDGTMQCCNAGQNIFNDTMQSLQCCNAGQNILNDTMQSLQCCIAGQSISNNTMQSLQCCNAIGQMLQCESNASQHSLNGVMQPCCNAGHNGTMQCWIAGQTNATQWLNAWHISTPQQVVPSHASGMLSLDAPGCPGDQVVWFVVLSVGVVMPVALAYQLEAAARREFLKARGLVGGRQGWEMGGRSLRWIESVLWWWQLGAVLAMLWQLLDLGFW